MSNGSWCKFNTALFVVDLMRKLGTKNNSMNLNTTRLRLVVFRFILLFLPLSSPSGRCGIWAKHHSASPRGVWLIFHTCFWVSMGQLPHTHHPDIFYEHLSTFGINPGHGQKTLVCVFSKYEESLCVSTNIDHRTC